MKTAVMTLVAVLLSGCSTLERYGIGGAPLIFCRQGVAVIDDRIAGPDSARLSLVRRIKDADALCKPVSLSVPLPAASAVASSPAASDRFRMRNSTAVDSVLYKDGVMY